MMSCEDGSWRISWKGEENEGTRGVSSDGCSNRERREQELRFAEGRATRGDALYA